MNSENPTNELMSVNAQPNLDGSQGVLKSSSQKTKILTTQSLKSLLKGLIQINTINPPGNELPLCKFLGSFFEKCGINYRIIESKPNRGNIIARLQAKDATEKPLLLLSHIDTVPLGKRELWSADPLAGVERDGFIWGRGAFDDKNHTSVFAAIMKSLKESKINLRRDIIFAATCDEEAGGENGLGFITKNFKEEVNAGFAINEGGGPVIKIGKRKYSLIQIAEKGVAWLKLTVKGKGGHASIPPSNNPTLIVAEAIRRLSMSKPEIRLTNPVRVMLEKIKCDLGLSYLPVERILGIRSIASKLFTLFPYDKTKMVRAWCSNTYCPTVISGGEKVNVVPDEVSCMVDCRILPGVTREMVLSNIKKILSPLPVELEIIQFHRAQSTEVDTPLYKTIEDVMGLDSVELLPFMLPAFTDSRFLLKNGAVVYGFFPLTDTLKLNEIMQLAHSVNERILIDDLVYAYDKLYEVVKRFCSK